AFIGVADEFLLHSVGKPVPKAALAEAEITRVFLEQCGIKEIGPESGRYRIREGCSKALPVSGGTLTVRWKLVLSLTNAGLKGDNPDCDRVKRGLHKQVKLFTGIERRSVVPARYGKLGQNA